MKLTHRRRGRPRLNNPKVDKGTEELQKKRKILLKKGIVQTPFLAESLLGLLFAHNMISRSLYETGNTFRELGYRYETCLGYISRRRSSVLMYTKGTNVGKDFAMVDKYDERITRAWRQTLRVLKNAGVRPYQIVLRVVFYDQDLYTNPFPHELLNPIGPLQKGLECLEIFFKEGLKDKKDMLYDQVLNRGTPTMSPLPLKESQFGRLL